MSIRTKNISHQNCNRTFIECRTQSIEDPESRIRTTRILSFIEHFRPFTPFTFTVRLHSTKTIEKVNEVPYKSFLGIFNYAMIYRIAIVAFEFTYYG